ncbi:PI-PLC X domain-containing protein 1-like [Gadus macrocephalus]|uniref:PI-PLC X domain-containing protein 1-like n=1 Tax=Gadus macrocephalus TaxID=80720 RepID=UPI0028CB6D8D|nr:PI-PLC X domain-containing protein 1-like [Gadus macrocephalus]
MAESGPQEGGTTEGNDNLDWMSKLPSRLQRVSLWNLAIPGSHDTMGYDLDMESDILDPESLIPVSKLHCVRALIHKWATTQELNICQQLDAGVRFFDMRVARKPDDPDPTRTFFYHGLYTHSDVETVLSTVSHWAAGHPTEVLLLALSHFRGMEDHHHQHLIDFITQLFGAKLVLVADQPTLRFCWDSGRHILVSYDHPANHNLQMWRKIPYFYGNTIFPSEVVTVLDKKLRTQTPINYFFVCGLNLTLPDGLGALKYLSKTLRSVTLEGLPYLLDWVNRQYPGPFNDHINIIASDFVNLLDFVSTVVQLNGKMPALLNK